jgi:hypothetical protein
MQSSFVGELIVGAETIFQLHRIVRFQESLTIFRLALSAG